LTILTLSAVKIFSRVFTIQDEKSVKRHNSTNNNKDSTDRHEIWQDDAFDRLNPSDY